MFRVMMLAAFSVLFSMFHQWLNSARQPIVRDNVMIEGEIRFAEPDDKVKIEGNRFYDYDRES